MDVRIVGTDLPGRRWGAYDEIHVGIQRKRDAEDLVPGDAARAAWDVAVDVVTGSGDDELDFRGPHVQGKRGERFLYLSWGTVDGGGTFEMFRRAKLMLGDVEIAVVRAADRPGRRLEGTLGLTDGRGGPLSAAIRPPVITWEAPPS